MVENAVLSGRRGKYELRKLLGKGGMGTVWLARVREGQLEGRDVVVKLPNEDSVSIDKLNFEINILQSISHPHIISFMDSGFYGNLPFLVEEYVKGSSLDLVAAGKPLDESEAKKHVIETLLALDYIHSRNIVHRDVKPKNLLVKEDGKITKLIDFGTCTYFNKVGLSEAVISPGGYTAPEQHFRTTSPQADIWSVGAVFFFLLTGQNPAIALPGYPNTRCPPPDPRKFNSDVSNETAEVIMKAMAWDPSERFLSAREMIDAIEKYTLPEEGVKDVPVLEVMGEKIEIDAPILRFGRLHEGSGTTTSSEDMEVGKGGRVKVVRSGDVIEVWISDPYNWISRRHFEIFEKNGKWFIKDLGSLNRTAVRTRGMLKEIWAGYKVEGEPFELGEKAIIYVAYGSSLQAPPYLTITFRRRGSK